MALNDLKCKSLRAHTLAVAIAFFSVMGDEDKMLFMIFDFAH